MALQMFACTATQTCVVNILTFRRSQAAKDRSIGDERVLKSVFHQIRPISLLSSLRPVFLLYFFLLFIFSVSYFVFCFFRFLLLLVDREALIASYASKPSHRLDRSIAARHRWIRRMDLVLIILKFGFPFFYF